MNVLETQLPRPIPVLKQTDRARPQGFFINILRAPLESLSISNKHSTFGHLNSFELPKLSFISPHFPQVLEVYSSVTI